MESLWETFKPAIGLDKVGLDVRTQLEDLALKFDSLAWESDLPLHEHRRLQQSILGLSIDAISNQEWDAQILEVMMKVSYGVPH